MRAVATAVGLFVAALGALMLVCAVVDLAGGAPSGQGFLVWGVATIFVGGCAARVWWGTAAAPMTPRQVIFLTFGLWAAAPFVAAAPLALAPGSAVSYTDGFFEAMSGLTTTGATVFVGLEELSTGVALWRALLQWIGGIGIVLTAIVALPLLGVGGMQLFRIEGGGSGDKASARAQQAAAWAGASYGALTGLCVLAYWLCGMSGFDALAHGLTTVSTGGFSTYDASLAAFESRAIESVAIVFMILGALPFTLYACVWARRLDAARGGAQARWMLGMLGLFVLAVWLARGLAGGGLAGGGVMSGGAISGAGASFDTLFDSLFAVTSVMTGTGYATADYGLWGGAVGMLVIMAMFMGGCAGSTACGIKTFRVAIVIKALWRERRVAGFSHRVALVSWEGRPLPASDVASVFNFVAAYMLAYLVFALLTAATGSLDIATALSAAAACFSNVGPALGSIAGPAGSYAPLPDATKWVLGAAMLIGRLEALPALALVLALVRR